MYSIHHSLGFLKAYLKVGHEFNIPAFIYRQVESSLHINLDTVLSDRDIIVDTILTAEVENFRAGIPDFYSTSLKNLKPGISYLILHTAYLLWCIKLSGFLACTAGKFTNEVFVGIA